MCISRQREHGDTPAHCRVAGVGGEKIDAPLDTLRHHEIIVGVQQDELRIDLFERGGHLVEKPDGFRKRVDFERKVRIIAAAGGDELAVIPRAVVGQHDPAFERHVTEIVQRPLEKWRPFEGRYYYREQSGIVNFHYSVRPACARRDA